MTTKTDKAKRELDSTKELNEDIVKVEEKLNEIFKGNKHLTATALREYIESENRKRSIVVLGSVKENKTNKQLFINISRKSKLNEGDAVTITKIYK